MAYVGSGKAEVRLYRHAAGLSSLGKRGVKPDAAYVLICARSRRLVFMGRRGHTPPQPTYLLEEAWV